MSKPPSAFTRNTLLDFSNRAELGYLADLARAVKGAAGDLPYYLAGATARDLLLEHAHGINPGRDTTDLDLGIMLADWKAFERLRLAALSVLKLVAWEERRWRRPGADAQDIAVILQSYLDAGNQERLFTEAEHLLDAPDFDFEAAGAWLLGHDMAQLLPKAARPRIGDLLERESDPGGAIHLIGDLPIEPERALGLLQSLARGFRENSG